MNTRRKKRPPTHVYSLTSAKVNDATSLEVTGLRWFKIAEEGWDPVSDVWAVDRLIANNGRWDIRIPNCIAPGEYLLRHELVALHAAGTYPGAQFYVRWLFSFSLMISLLVVLRIVWGR